MVRKLLCAITLVFLGASVASAALTIQAAGAHLSLGEFLRTTTVDKPWDANPDNVYGTDGYIFWGLGDGGAGKGSLPPASYETAVLPPYIAAIAYAPSVAVAMNYTYRNIDDPRLPPGPDVPNVRSGVLNCKPAASGQEVQLLTITLQAPLPSGGFRLGVFTDNADGTRTDLVPTALRLTGSNGVEASVSTAPAGPTTSNLPTDLDCDIYFFDIRGAAVGDSITLYATARLAVPTVIGGLLFDTNKTAAAGTPSPANGATDVPRQVVLKWKPGQFAGTHDIYLGTIFADVNDARRSDPRAVLVSQGQAGATYDAGSLAFGTTYYWRVDEVNAPPDSTIFKGTVWSFTTEPKAYPVDGATIHVTASSAAAGQGPENTINGSGLSANLHSSDFAAMWLTAADATGPAWIQYEFDRVLRLDSLWVWNQNGNLEAMLGLGCKDVTIEYSTDGVNYQKLGTTHEFARGPGAPDYAHNTTVDLGEIAAKYVKLTINSNWGGVLKQYGLSEVRFFSVPVFAREPSPTPGTTGVAVDATLSWRSGREAAAHQVYLGTDQQAVSDGTAPVQTVTVPSLTPALNLASTYYWRVAETNQAEPPSTWAGDVWSFSTQEYIVVDDFESYTDDMDAGQAIWQAWIDGYDIPSNGSVVGNDPSPFAERTIINSGKQSMPLAYDNAGTATNSEATRTFASPQDWGKHGIKGLTLRFYGDPANVAQQMYVKINNTKVPYDGDAADLLSRRWQMWYIDLTKLSVSSVTKLSIGFDRINGIGGAGKVFIDDIRLYSYDRPLVTPVLPDAANLAGYWPLDGNPNDLSGKGHNGAIEGGVLYGEGKSGSAADFNGSNALINCGDVPILGTDGAFSIACWVKPRNIAQDWAGIVSKWTADNTKKTLWLGQHSTNGWLRFSIFPNGPTTETALDSGRVILANDEWTHVVCTYDGSIQKIYAGGAQVVASGPRNPVLVDRGGNLLFGKVSTANWFNGLLDEVRIYDRALSPAEVAGLAGRTKSFDKPF